MTSLIIGCLILGALLVVTGAVLFLSLIPRRLHAHFPHTTTTAQPQPTSAIVPAQHTDKSPARFVSDPQQIVQTLAPLNPVRRSVTVARDGLIARSVVKATEHATTVMEACGNQVLKSLELQKKVRAAQNDLELQPLARDRDEAMLLAETAEYQLGEAKARQAIGETMKPAPAAPKPQPKPTVQDLRRKYKQEYEKEIAGIKEMNYSSDTERRLVREAEDRHDDKLNALHEGRRK